MEYGTTDTRRTPLSNTQALRGEGGFIDIREPGTGKLLFRYHPERDVIEIARRGVVTEVSLAAVRRLGGNIPESGLSYHLGGPAN